MNWLLSNTEHLFHERVTCWYVYTLIYLALRARFFLSLFKDITETSISIIDLRIELDCSYFHAYSRSRVSEQRQYCFRTMHN